MERGTAARYQHANVQRTIVRGSQEPGFQGDSMWDGIDQYEIPVDDNYFYSYSHYSIHEEMLKDHVRTETYMHAILQNPELFEGKVVLDVGCGTGILSIFAARAGARHVYGIDAAEIASSVQSTQARQIISENRLQDRITIIQGKAEEVQLPVDKVDIIVSEWMGYFLLYEGMLDTVLFARDKWLAPGGIVTPTQILPDTAILYFAGLEDAEYREAKVDFWDSVYGVNMSVLKDFVISEPLVDNAEAHAICTETACVHTIKLENVRREDIHFVARYRVRATRKDSVHALIAWFDVQFNHGSKVFTLSTSPRLPTTHWKQTIFYTDTPIPLFENEYLSGSIAVRRSPDHPRDLDVKISIRSEGQVPVGTTRFYRLK